MFGFFAGGKFIFREDRVFLVWGFSADGFFVVDLGKQEAFIMADGVGFWRLYVGGRLENECGGG